MASSHAVGCRAERGQRPVGGDDRQPLAADAPAILVGEAERQRAVRPRSLSPSPAFTAFGEALAVSLVGTGLTLTVSSSAVVVPVARTVCLTMTPPLPESFATFTATVLPLSVVSTSHVPVVDAGEQ